MSTLYKKIIAVVALCIALLACAQPTGGHVGQDHVVIADIVVVEIATTTPAEPKTPQEVLWAIGTAKGLPASKIREIEGVIGGVPGTGCPNGESDWNVHAIGDNGNSFGLAQIHLPSHPHVTPDMAFDPEYALTFMVDAFLADDEWMWTCWREIYDTPLLPHPEDVPVLSPGGEETASTTVG